MSANVTEALAGFASSLQYQDVPQRVRDHCKNLLLDTLACAVAGHRGEETQQLAALAAALGQSNEASVIGGEALSLAGATILNGYLVTAVTMCDVHRPTLTHVTPEVIPPALAIAERDGASGRDLLVALAAGCEVTTRIGIGLDYPVFRAKGWHGPGVLGPFGAAASAGCAGSTRDHGQGLRARRQPGGRHFRRVGNADREVPPEPGRALGASGGAARRAEVLGDARIPHRRRWRPLQCLREWRPSGGGHGGSGSAELDDVLRPWPSASIQGMNTAHLV
jgi:hypothetical protein